ncbi:MAG: C40 family peptidase [Candidatus Marinimicrobia bacterium]|nr:C40 family peptidase [Candidatus Neomarinimicrobiota bacterium]MCF7851346.1 C40 family peptidase [Candidatus Neomarinimicrobiota bacterium]MCF7905060.1 C40 family peptidase [Candidatus Neomarinimicrobiota bacterium]
MKPIRVSLLVVISVTLWISNCASNRVSTAETSPQGIIAQANEKFYLDDRIWYQDVQSELKGGKLILTGEAFFKIPIKGIGKKLRKAGYELEIVDKINYLPQSFPLDKGYAVVTEPYIMSRYQPVEVKQEGTELLYGEPVRLIRDAGKYYQVQSPTGYLGYIPKTSVRTMDIAEWNTYHHPEQAIFDKPATLKNGLEIKMGTRLPFLTNGNILLADGSEYALYGDAYHVTNAAANPLRNKIIETGKKYLDLPYVWGGRSADGVDCSGFVGQSYSLNGVYLQRDTDEMANTGRIIGLPGWTEAMLPGDLLFFTGSRRLVTHVAIYMGDGKVIHSLGSGVQIQSIDPSDADYAEGLHRRFIFAKRIFD